ncbi:MAG: cytochrome c family protein [Candidatus Magnetominusculus sp. LBB02]|nr:cytochrome c family protein [Candidatus Magnetominusculus sp. LBB02]
MKRYLLAALVLNCFLIITSAEAVIDKVGDIGNASEACAACHAEIYTQWKSSVHEASLLHSIDNIYSYIIEGIEKDPVRKGLPLKTELMKCLHCHAPVMEQASDKFVREVVDAIKIAGGKSANPDAMKKAKDLLSHLNVSCYTCHNMKAVSPPNTPENQTVYGLKGGANVPYHAIKKTAYLDNAIFCMQCHGVYTAPDMERIICSTIAQSYRDQYVAAGGQTTCQDCHMRKNNRGHSFPGAYVPEMLKEGIALDITARAFKSQSYGDKKWIPAAAITVDVTNRAGHRVPDGCMWTSRVVLTVTATNEKDKVVWTAQKEFFEPGLDTDGNRRYDTWQIKDILDYSLQPRKTTTEKYYAVFPEHEKLIKLEAKITYIHKDGLEFPVHSERKVLRYN